MSIEDIKNQLSANWKTWDDNEDGKLDSGDLLGRFDTDGDGVISENELEQIAEQLSTQLEYTNSLLQELQEAENTQLELQKELNSKSEMLRIEKGTSDSLRNENIEMRRKWKISQEIADSMTKQSKDYRVEVRSLKSELERLELEHNERQNLLTEAINDRDRSKRDLEMIQSEYSRAHDESNGANNSLKEANASLQEMNEDLASEIAELKSKLSPLEQEKYSNRQHVHELSQSLEEATVRYENESNMRLAAEKKVRELAALVDKAKDRYTQVRIEHDDARSRYELAAVKVRELETSIVDLEAKLQDSEATATSLAMELEHAQHTRQRNETEIENLQSELESSRQLLLSEKEGFTMRSAEAAAIERKNLDEAYARANEGIAEASRKIKAEEDERRRIEIEYHKKAEEVLELNKLLKSAQDDSHSRTHSFDVERGTYEDALRVAKLETAAAHDDYRDLQNELEIERETCNNIVKDLRKEILFRGSRFAETLEAFQKAANSLKSESADLRDQLKSLSAEYNVLKNCSTRVMNLGGLSRGPETELITTMSKLFTKIASIREKLEDTKDDLARTSIAREEAKGKLLTMQDTISTTEHSLAMEQQRSRAEISRLRLKVEELSQACKKEQVSRIESEERLRKAQGNLEAANAQSRSLHQQNQNLTITLDDASMRQSTSRQEMDARAIELAAQLKQALQERDKEANAKLVAAERIEELRVQLEQERQVSESARSEINQKIAYAEELRAKQVSAIANAGGNQQKYQQQLSQMQSMNKTLQAGKKELAAENQRLREELRGFYESERHAVAHAMSNSD